jgi:regulator of protease activity HflC (stomatin/prohibitin superfamily)
VKIAAAADSEKIKITADANAHKTKVEGEAQAEVTLSVGNAEAEVIKKKVDSMGEGYTLVQAVDKLMQGGKSIVPTVLINGENGNNGGVINGMLGYNLLTGILKHKDLLAVAPEEEKVETAAENKGEEKKK